MGRRTSALFTLLVLGIVLLANGGANGALEPAEGGQGLREDDENGKVEGEEELSYTKTTGQVPPTASIPAQPYEYTKMEYGEEGTDSTLPDQPQPVPIEYLKRGAPVQPTAPASSTVVQPGAQEQSQKQDLATASPPQLGSGGTTTSSAPAANMFYYYDPAASTSTIITSPSKTGVVAYGQKPPTPPESWRKQQVEALAQIRPQAAKTDSNADASSPCFAVVKDSDLSLVFRGSNFKACPLAKVVLLNPSQGGPADGYTWDSSGSSDANVFSLNLLQAEGGDSGSQDTQQQQQPVVVALTGDGPIRAKPLAVRGIVFDGSGLNAKSTNAAFLAQSGLTQFEATTFSSFPTPVLAITSDYTAKVSKSQFVGGTAATTSQVQVIKGSFTSDDNTFRGLKGPAISSVGAFNQITLSKTRFEEIQGSALYLKGGQAGCDSCAFIGNKGSKATPAVVSILGGGVFGVQRSLFRNNGVTAIYSNASTVVLNSVLFQGGVSDVAGALYAEGGGFVFGSVTYFAKNSAPTITTVGNVTLVLTKSCFTDNGADQASKPRVLNQLAPTKDTNATLTGYCSFYTNDSYAKSTGSDFHPAPSTPTSPSSLTVITSDSSTCLKGCTTDSKADAWDPTAPASRPPADTPFDLAAPVVLPEGAAAPASVLKGTDVKGPATAASAAATGSAASPTTNSMGATSAALATEWEERQAHLAKTVDAYSEYCDFRGRPLYRSASPTSLEQGASDADSSEAGGLTALSVDTTDDTDTCWGSTARLVLYIESVVLSDHSCFVNGSASPFVMAKIGGTTLWTMAVGEVQDNATSVDIMQFLELGCQSITEPLYLDVQNFNDRSGALQCSWWQIDDWTALLDSKGTVVVNQPNTQTTGSGKRRGLETTTWVPESNLIVLDMPLESPSAQINLTVIAENTTSLIKPMQASITLPPDANVPPHSNVQATAPHKNGIPAAVAIALLLAALIALSCCVARCLYRSHTKHGLEEKQRQQRRGSADQEAVMAVGGALQQPRSGGGIGYNIKAPSAPPVAVAMAYEV